MGAGVYEDARHAYLNEVLIRRVGCSAGLAVIYSDVMRRLLMLGALDFGVRVECRNLSVLPTAEVRPWLRPAEATTENVNAGLGLGLHRGSS